jgi:hypothetical protein
MVGDSGEEMWGINSLHDLECLGGRDTDQVTPQLLSLTSLK